MKKLSGAVHLARDDDGGDGDGEWNGMDWPTVAVAPQRRDGWLDPSRHKEQRTERWFVSWALFRFSGTSNKRFFSANSIEDDVYLSTYCLWLAIKVEENKLIPLLQRWKLQMEYMTIVTRHSLSRCRVQDSKIRITMWVGLFVPTLP